MTPDQFAELLDAIRYVADTLRQDPAFAAWQIAAPAVAAALTGLIVFGVELYFHRRDLDERARQEAIVAWRTFQQVHLEFHTEMYVAADFANSEPVDRGRALALIDRALAKGEAFFSLCKTMTAYDDDEFKTTVAKLISAATKMQDGMLQFKKDEIEKLEIDDMMKLSSEISKIISDRVREFTLQPKSSQRKSSREPVSRWSRWRERRRVRGSGA